MWQLCIIYESGKRYIIPFETLSKHLTKEQIETIKKEALKEVQKL
jgi:hypothetical protein